MAEQAAAFRPSVARAAAATAEARGRIAAQHESGGQGWAVCVLATELFDAIVLDVWEAIIADLSADDADLVRRSASLVAHGGCGRAEMAPWSDLDLMILHNGRIAPLVADIARRLLQDLFDAGLEVGQSVRTVGEAVSLAGGDATIMSSLLDCRRLAGAEEPVRRLQQRLRKALALARGLFGHEVDGRFRVGPVDVAATSASLPRVAGSVREIVRLAELAMLYEMPVARDTWEAVRAAVPALPREPDGVANEAFLALFAHPTKVAAALRWLHDVGVLEILIPQFEHARNLLQFNSFHKYTVDEHCLIAIERAAAFASADDWLGVEWRSLRRTRPLLVALLLHDIGKGFVEDHSVLGARISREVATRLGLPDDEAEIVEFLVRRHLAMAHLAFRRDVGDDTLVVGFAGDVGSPEVLRMLALLTAADVSAVGPGTWTQWKSDLLASLFYKTLGILDGDGPTAAADRTRRELARLVEDRAADDPVVRLTRDLPAAYLGATPPARIVEELGRLGRLSAGGVFATARWQPETSTVAVTVGTREDVVVGIFHRVTGSLTSQRLEILAADIHTFADGHVVDHFTVLDPDFTGEPPADRLADIAAAIKAAILGDRPPEFAPRWNPFAPQVRPAARQPVRVAFDNQSSRQATILEVFAHDAPGLLYGVAKVLFDAGLSVQAAKIGTYLDQVVDAFHVTAAGGGKLTDPERQQAIRAAIEKAVAPITGPA